MTRRAATYNYSKCWLTQSEAKTCMSTLSIYSPPPFWTGQLKAVWLHHWAGKLMPNHFDQDVSLLRAGYAVTWALLPAWSRLEVIIGQSIFYLWHVEYEVHQNSFWRIDCAAKWTRGHKEFWWLSIWFSRRVRFNHSATPHIVLSRVDQPSIFFYKRGKSKKNNNVRHLWVTIELDATNAVVFGMEGMPNCHQLVGNFTLYSCWL